MGLRRANYLIFTAILLALTLFVILLALPAARFLQLSNFAPSLHSEHKLVTTPTTTVTVSSTPTPTTTKHPPPDIPGLEQDKDAVNMTIKANKFTPEVLLSAPRRSTAKPNEDGSTALYTLSTYSFDSHKKNSEIRLFDVASKQSTLVTNEPKTSEPNWLEGDILYLRAGKNGSTELVVANIEGGMKTYTIASVPGPIGDVKLKNLGPGKFAFLCSGKTAPDGTLYNPETAPEKHNTAMLYDSLIVRHWDKFVTENKNSLWYGLLSKKHDTGKWHLSPLIDALQDSDLESPVEPFPGGDHFDISQYGVGFVAKAPDLDPAYHTRTDFYFVPISDFQKTPSSKPIKADAKGLAGASSAPAFSTDGRSVAYLSMKKDGYEADKNRIILIQDVTAGSLKTFELLQSDDGKGLWDRSPNKLVWANNKRRLLVFAEDIGMGLVYKFDVEDQATKSLPEKITTVGHTTEAVPLGDGKLFLSGDSTVDNSVWATIDPDDTSTLVQVSSNSRNGEAFGLEPDQVTDFWYEGAKGRRVHALVVKPSSNVHKPPMGLKWPLAMLIHGGPQGAWSDSWSTRWNPAIFAEQGYYVVMPNPTGSTSYGQDFTDAIQENWGGDPFDDIVACFDHIENKFNDTIDTKRAVALGASYGGYMMNWIQGHSFVHRFMALVCHDGVFSMANMVSSDEQYFPIHEFGGTFWENREEYDKWDPARRTENWGRPMLVIHSDKDYRLPISEGLAAFNVLQKKGIESRFLTFPDENHWVLNAENSLVWHTVVINWINSFVGLPPYKDENELLSVDGGRWRKPKVAGSKA